MAPTDPGRPGELALIRLMSWLSPAFPVGSFAYSHGLEYAVEAGLVRDRKSLLGWLTDVLIEGAGRVDAVLLTHVWRAFSNGNRAEVEELVDRATAWRGTAETALESMAQGRAFMAAVGAGWPEVGQAGSARGDGGEKGGDRSGYPQAIAHGCAVGIAAAAAGISSRQAVLAYLNGFATNLVSAGVRLIPLGQREGVWVLARLEPVIMSVGERADGCPLEDLGTATWMVDWTSMQHETQRTRLFRS